MNSVFGIPTLYNVMVCVNYTLIKCFKHLGIAFITHQMCS